MGDWLSWIDGAETDGAIKARNEAVTEVAWLGAGVAGMSLALGALEGYNHAKDPSTGGQPQIGPLALDSVVGILGIGGAILFGDVLGEKGQLLALGSGLAGLASVGGHYGRVLGADMYKPSGTHGNKTGALEEKSKLSPQSQAVYDEFIKKAA